MKIKEDLMLRNICNEWMVIPMGERLAEFDGMMKLNETGAFFWNLLQQDTDAEAMTAAAVAEYEITTEQARQAIDQFLDTLRKENLLDE